MEYLIFSFCVFIALALANNCKNVKHSSAILKKCSYANLCLHTFVTS